MQNKMVKHLNVGENRGKPRLWFEGKSLEANEFEPGTALDIEYGNGYISIHASILGTNTVSGRAGRPIIDINNTMISASLGGVKRIKVVIDVAVITIYPLSADEEIKGAHYKAENPDFTFVDIFAGGGTSSHSAESCGLRSIGAVEYNDETAELYRENFPHSEVISGSVLDMTHADWSRFKGANVILASPPCPAFSPAGKSARGKDGKNEEEHESGFLGFAVLQAVEAIRPSHVVIENVPSYRDSAIMSVIRQALFAWGYTHQSETILDGADINDMTRRRRYAGVFSVKPGFEFNFSPMEPKPVSSILERNLEDREWLDESTATVATFVRRAEEHVAKGNGFKSGAVKPNALLVPAITAGYAKRRLTDGMLAHPTKPNTISFFTPREAARIHGIDNSFILPDTKTLAYQVIGNGISVRAWSHSVFGPLFEHLQQTAITASAA